MSEALHSLSLTSEQLFAERVHLGLRSPTTIRAIRTYRILFAVLGGLLLGIGLVAMVVQPLGPDGEPTGESLAPLGVAAIVVGLVCIAAAALMPVYLRASVTLLERKSWSYLGDDGAVVELSAAGLALDAPARSVRIGWGYYDDVAVLDSGLELRRRGGPVAFYPIAAFASEQAAWQAADDVRRWIVAAQR